MKQRHDSWSTNVRIHLKRSIWRINSKFAWITGLQPQPKWSTCFNSYTWAHANGCSISCDSIQFSSMKIAPDYQGLISAKAIFHASYFFCLSSKDSKSLLKSFDNRKTAKMQPLSSQNFLLGSHLIMHLWIQGVLKSNQMVQGLRATHMYLEKFIVIWFFDEIIHCLINQSVGVGCRAQFSIGTKSADWIVINPELWIEVLAVSSVESPLDASWYLGNGLRCDLNDVGVTWVSR